MLPVLIDDPGIRPAGRHDACFYCGNRVGQSHDPECVIIVRDVIYAAYVGERRIGTWTNPEPASWSPVMCEFMRNGGSWCSDNMRQTGHYVGQPLPTPTGDGCLCNLLTLEFDSRAGETRHDGPDHIADKS